MKKKIRRVLSISLAIVMLVVLLAGFSYPTDTYTSFWHGGKVEADDIFPPKRPEKIAMKHVEYPYPGPDYTWDEYYDFMEERDLPDTLPETVLEGKHLAISMENKVANRFYKNAVITTREELDCYYSYYFDIYGAVYEVFRAPYMELTELDFSEQAVIILSKAILGNDLQFDRIVVDGNRLIVVFSSNVGWDTQNNQTNAYSDIYVVNKQDLPAAGNDLELYYTVEYPNRGISYTKETVGLFNGRMLFVYGEEAAQYEHIHIQIQTSATSDFVVVPYDGEKSISKLRYELNTIDRAGAMKGGKEFYNPVDIPASAFENTIDYEVLVSLGDSKIRNTGYISTGFYARTALITNEHDLDLTFYAVNTNGFYTPNDYELYLRLKETDWSSKSLLMITSEFYTPAKATESLAQIALYDGRVIISYDIDNVSVAEKDGPREFGNVNFYILLVDKEDLPIDKTTLTVLSYYDFQDENMIDTFCTYEYAVEAGWLSRD